VNIFTSYFLTLVLFVVEVYATGGVWWDVGGCWGFQEMVQILRIWVPVSRAGEGHLRSRK